MYQSQKHDQMSLPSWDDIEVDLYKESDSSSNETRQQQRYDTRGTENRGGGNQATTLNDSRHLHNTSSKSDLPKQSKNYSNSSSGRYEERKQPQLNESRERRQYESSREYDYREGNSLRNFSDRNASYRGHEQPQQVFDEFKYKELCLNAASKTKSVATYLTKIKDHITREACLEWEVSPLFCFSVMY
jgi:hypothetical protein